MINDFIICGDSSTAYDDNFIKQNKIFYIINTDINEIFNIYEYNQVTIPAIAQKLEETRQKMRALIGKIYYFNIP